MELIFDNIESLLSTIEPEEASDLLAQIFKPLLRPHLSTTQDDLLLLLDGALVKTLFVISTDARGDYAYFRASVETQARKAREAGLVLAKGYSPGKPRKCRIFDFSEAVQGELFGGGGAA